jgi:hypothetical protein
MSQAQDAAYQPKPEIIEHPARAGHGFDLRTHIKNAKTGETIRVQPYRRFSVGLSTYYERPKMSGNLFFEDGKPAGRRFLKDGKFVIDEALPHADFVAARTEFVKPEDIAQENEALRAELAALQSEKEAKVTVVQPKAQAASQKR